MQIAVWRVVLKRTELLLVSTAIGSRKYRIPSDLRSQAGYRLVSTMVGDHMGILGVVVFVLVEVDKVGRAWGLLDLQKSRVKVSR